MIIYLSPANHNKNYANGSAEKIQMEKLAPIVKAMLEEYEGVIVYLPTVYAANGQYDGRPEEAKYLKADYYIALHTNASGMSATGGKAKGACGFYHPAVKNSKEIATQIVLNLNAVCPFKSNRAVTPAIYQQGRDTNLGELRIPANYGMCPVLIEHEFHDRLEGAEWICGNLETIAQADVDGIASVLGLKKKLEKGDVNGDGKVDNLDAATVLMYDAGLIKLEKEQLSRADINGDGVVNSLDAAEILKEDSGK